MREMDIKKIYIFSFLLLICGALNAQAQQSDETEDNVGKKSFSREALSEKGQGYLGLGFVLGANDFTNGEAISGASNEIIMGNRSFIDLGEQNLVKLGFDSYYRFTQYRIKQDSLKSFPFVNQEVDKERLSSHSLGLEVFGRIRFDNKSKKKQGYTLDLGVYGEWNFANRHIIWTKAAEQDLYDLDSKKQKTVNKGLKYMNRWEYGLSGRIGIKNFAIYGNYRMSSLFNKDHNRALHGELFDNDMPNIIVGIQVDM